MESLFEDLKEGLEEAIAFQKGELDAKVTHFVILPVRKYDSREIRSVRMTAGMTQSVFASYLGVSPKTVEAWERGRTHPTGPAYRMIDLLALQKTEGLPFIRRAEQKQADV